MLVLGRGAQGQRGLEKHQRALFFHLRELGEGHCSTEQLLWHAAITLSCSRWPGQPKAITLACSNYFKNSLAVPLCWEGGPSHWLSHCVGKGAPLPLPWKGPPLSLAVPLCWDAGPSPIVLERPTPLLTHSSISCMREQLPCLAVGIQSEYCMPE